MEELERLREFLKDTVRTRVDFSRTGQGRGLPPPPVEKPCPVGAVRVDLPGADAWRGIAGIGLETAIGRRKSRRAYRAAPLTLDELAFLLWATQGVRGRPSGDHAYRTVPSAGCRHALETYVAAFRVDGLEPALYRYLPLTHQLVLERHVAGLDAKLADAAYGQAFTGRGAATFVWCAVPARMEWRYGEASHKVIALDAGHACQNLYLACEAIGAGTCAVAAYDQRALDALLGVDGREEFAIYLAPVGKV